MPKLSQSQADQVKTLCGSSLHFLCTQFLGYKLWDKVHDDVEILLKRPSQRKAILLPRDHSKSTFVTIAWSLQQVLKDPNIRILITNGVWDQARKFLMEIKGQLEQSQLKYLFGEFVSARWNADDIIVKQRTKPLKEPTIFTSGVEAESVGSRADIIIADDLMGEQNCNTSEQRAKVKKYRRALVNVLEPGWIMIDIMTRWHLDDTYGEIIEKEKSYYDVMVRKVVEDGKLIYPKKFSKKFDPIRKAFIDAPNENCLDYVDYLRSTKPLDEFSSQYMNEPLSVENQLFKPEMFKYWSERPKELFIGMAVDLAASAKSSADYTAITVCGMDKEYNLYVLDYIRGHWSKPSDIVDNVFQMRDRWKPHTVGMEVNGFQHMLKLGVEEEMRKRRNYFAIEEIRNGPQKSKFERIKCLEPFYRGGNVFHAAWMKGKDLENELQTVSGDGIKGKHDDLMDSFSMALPYLRPGFSTYAYQEDDWDRWMRLAQENSGKINGFLNYGS